MFLRPTTSPLLRLCLLPLLITVVPCLHSNAQTEVASSSSSALPDAPTPQQTATETAPQEPETKPAQAPPVTSRPLVPPPPDAKLPNADEDLRKAEKQRVLGIMPAFNMVNNAANIAPLRPKQKFQLMWKSSTDPFIFTLDAFIAGIGQAEDSNSGTKNELNPNGTITEERWGWGQGAKGYFQRFAASYADTFDGNFWGNAVLPVVLKEDPRYFRLGTGSFTRRFLYSASTTIWCRRDNGKWGPNYANVAGNFISGAISNLYYPSEEGGFEKTTIGALTVTAEGTFGAELIEFWPDIEHHFRKKHQPTP
jgi:hypothetical protein